MKIVIDIPEEEYLKLIKTDENGEKEIPLGLLMSLWDCVKYKCTPLAKGHKRKFEEIVVEYPPAELCTYPEYKGKPYFSIKYEENGEHIIGFGTYKSEVLSEYIREYFIAKTNIENVGMCQQNVGEMSEKQADGDLINRQAAIDIVVFECGKWTGLAKEISKQLKQLPSADNTAEWVSKEGIFGVAYCSKCDYELHTDDTNYCPNCGRRMKGVGE